MSEDF